MEGDEIRGEDVFGWELRVGILKGQIYSEFVFDICPFLFMVRKDRCYLIEIAPSDSGVIRPSINVN